MYRFALAPRWLAGHVLAGGLLMIFVIAGFWQLSRHGEVRDRNAATAERTEMTSLDVDGFFAELTDAELSAALEFRTVTLPIERFDWDDSVHIRNRSLQGIAGCHFVVPAAVAPNANTEPLGVLIVAGWLPAGGVCEDAVAFGADAFSGGLSDAAQITGRIRRSQQRGLLGPADPAGGRLVSLARTDVERINQQTDLDLVDVYVELTGAERADGTQISLGDNGSGTGLSALLRPLPPPERDAGPHLGYTIQWFGFAVVAVVGYTLVLRHQARRGQSEQIADD